MYFKVLFTGNNSAILCGDLNCYHSDVLLYTLFKYNYLHWVVVSHTTVVFAFKPPVYDMKMCWNDFYANMLYFTMISSKQDITPILV